MHRPELSRKAGTRSSPVWYAIPHLAHEATAALCTVPRMSTEQYQAMARYNSWINSRLVDATLTLSDEERKRDLGAFFGSIHRTLNHVLLGDYVWMKRLTGGGQACTPLDAQGVEIGIQGLDHVLYDDFALYTARRRELDGELLRLAEQLSESWLAETMSYANSKGVVRRHPRWWAVGHLFNHQTHHRGQVTAMLTRLGVDPGPTDLMVMQWSEAEAQQ